MTKETRDAIYTPLVMSPESGDAWLVPHGASEDSAGGSLSPRTSPRGAWNSARGLTLGAHPEDREAGAPSYAPLAEEVLDPNAATPTSADSACVNGDAFQSFIGSVILGNVFVLWGETDHPDWFIWVVCDNLTLCIFIVELMLRTLATKHVSEYFVDKDTRYWALLDLFCICLGMGDAWIMPLLEATGLVGATERVHNVIALLRMVRLIRILRIVKMFRQMVLLIRALRDIISTYVWIFAVLFMFLLTFALPFTHLLGHFEGFTDPQMMREHAKALATIQSRFGDVPTSLFTLFQLCTIDNWDEISDPLVEINPWWRAFFVFWMATCSWNMFAILTAVASHKMVNATADRKEKELREQENKQLAFIEFLRESFVEGDADGNGVLDYQEFVDMISQDKVLVRMGELGVHMSNSELLEAFQMLDTDESGELTIEEFVDGLSTLQEGLATKHIVGVDYAMKRVTRTCQTRMENVQAMAEEAVAESLKLNGKVMAMGNNDIDMELWTRWQANSDFGVWVKDQL